MRAPPFSEYLGPASVMSASGSMNRLLALTLVDAAEIVDSFSDPRRRRR